MTFFKYIQNPMGGTTQTNLQKEAISKIYTDKLNAIMVREVGKIKYTTYTDEKNDKYYIHIKIPSEVVPKFYYDTVIEFYAEDNTIRNDATLNNYFTRYYSNDPAFVFTYAHAFIDKDLFIVDLLPKMGKMAIKKVAEVKNPNNITGYVKSIYFAYLVIKTYSLFNKTSFRVGAAKYNKATLLNDIMHSDKKVADRQDEGDKIEKEKKKLKQLKATTRTPSNVATKTTGAISKIPGLNNIKKTNVIKSTITKTITTTKKK